MTPEVWTVQKILTWSATWLKDKNANTGVVQSPRLDAELLLAQVLECDRMRLYMDLDRPLTKDEREAFKTTLRRRGEGEPIAYILGFRDFFRHRFSVSSNVLIPRADTEILVERSLELIANEENPTVLDVGTGSGCVGISIALAKPTAQVTAWDISPEAVAVAIKNKDDLDCKNIQIELCDAKTAQPAQKFSHITSNPPYIARDEESSLSASVKSFEPQQALFDDGAADGLSFYRLLAARAAEWLIPGGTITVECGYTQAKQVHDIFAAQGLTELTITKDLAGMDRVVAGRLVV